MVNSQVGLHKLVIGGQVPAALIPVRLAPSLLAVSFLIGTQAGLQNSFLQMDGEFLIQEQLPEYKLKVVIGEVERSFSAGAERVMLLVLIAAL